MNVLKGSFFLKILALVSAIMTYVFIHNEMYQIKSKDSDPSYRLFKLTAKSLPLRVRLGTEPPDGYEIAVDEVMSRPSQVIVIGPEALLEEAFSAETAIIDVSENTKTVVKRIPLESVAGTHLVGEPYVVEVTVPIRKTALPAAAPVAPAVPEADSQTA